MPRIIGNPVFFRGIATTHVATKHCKTRLFQAEAQFYAACARKTLKGISMWMRDTEIYAGFLADSGSCTILG
jgi:hypothetical protein